MSSAPIGQRGKAPVPPEPDGRPAAPSGGAVAAPSGGPAGGGRSAAARYGPAATAGLTMAVLGVWGLARDSAMGNDEVVSRYAALLPLHQLAHLLRHVDAVHGLYYLLLHGWMAVGTSPAVMRIPSVIAMVAAVAMTVLIGRRLTGSGWAGLFAGLIMALTPTISFYAQTARSYPLVFACVLGSTLALLHAMRAEAPGEGAGAAAARPAGQRLAWYWVGYGALVTLGGYLNELSLLVLAAHAVTVLLARHGRRAVAHWALTSAVAALLVVPLAVLSTRQTGVVAWIPRPGLWSLRILFHDYFGATTVVAVLLLGCAVVAVLPPRGWWRRQRGSAVIPGAGAAGAPGAGSAGTAGAARSDAAWWTLGGMSLPSVAAPLLVVPGAVLILESLVARPLYVDRYVLYGEAGAALLAGAGIYRIGRWLAGQRSLIWVPGVLVCVCALVLQIAPQQRARTPQSRLFDFGGPSRYVAAHARTGDGLLFFSPFFRKVRLGYPDEFRKVSDFAMAVSPQRAGNFQGRNKPLPVIRPLMLDQRRIWVVGRPPWVRLGSAPIRAEAAVLKSSFSLVAKHHFKDVWVTLWLRR